MNQTEYVGACAKLSLLWPHQPMTSEAIKAGQGLLIDLDPDAVNAAIDSLAASGEQFIPTLGMVRKRAVAIVSPRLPDADEAWAEIRYQIELADNERGPVDWSHPIVREAALAFGWRELRFSDNPMADRAHFLAMYRERLAREESARVAPLSVVALQGRSVLAIGERSVSGEWPGRCGDGIVYR